MHYDLSRFIFTFSKHFRSSTFLSSLCHMLLSNEASGRKNHNHKCLIYGVCLNDDLCQNDVLCLHDNSLLTSPFTFWHHKTKTRPNSVKHQFQKEVDIFFSKVHKPILWVRYFGPCFFPCSMRRNVKVWGYGWSAPCSLSLQAQWVLNSHSPNWQSALLAG